MAFLRVAFQDPYDRNYCVPIPCRRWHTEQFVDLAKRADRFHMTTVDSEDESILRREDPQEPLPVGRKCGWNGRPDAASLRQDAHESNDIRACRLSRKRIFPLQAEKITGVAERNFRFERQLLEQFSAELCSRYRFTNHKRARSAHIDDIIVAQISCEDTWTKRSVSTNIDTSEEDNKSHTGIIWNYLAFVCGTPALPDAFQVRIVGNVPVWPCRSLFMMTDSGAQPSGTERAANVQVVATTKEDAAEATNVDGAGA